MKKILLLGWKDVTLAFRDRAGLILMLLAPFALTLGLGFVTGSLGGTSTSGVESIPVVLVNLDAGQLGGDLVRVFQSDELADLLDPELASDPAAAQLKVENDETAAAVLIPAGFSASIIPDAAGQSGPPAAIQLVANPARPTSSGIIQTILEQYLSRVEVGRAGGSVVVAQLLQSGRITPAEAPAAGAAAGVSLAESLESGQGISLKGVESGSAAPPFKVLAYMAPGMALMFLMFTVSNGGRTLLVEKLHGTLPRLLTAPITPGQVLLGKMFGIFLTGVAQLLILILASTVLFRLNWGSPLPVLALVLAAVAGAVGWGMLITALVKSPGQASSIGSAIMLVFGVLGGSFFELSRLPAWFRAASKITPNAWGIDGFTILAQGGGLAEILPDIGGLLVMAAALFGIALFLFTRRGIIQR